MLPIKFPTNRIVLTQFFRFLFFLIFYISTFNSVQNGENSMLIFQVVSEIQPFKGGMYPKLESEKMPNLKFTAARKFTP